MRAGRFVFCATSAAIAAGCVACASFPPNAAAHALGDHHHLVHVDAEEVRDDFLHLGGMLRRRMHGQLSRARPDTRCAACDSR